MEWVLIWCLFAVRVSLLAAEYPFTVKGNITLGDPHPPYKVNDEVLFNYSFRLEGDNNVTGLTYTFTSDTLQFLSAPLKSVADQISWFYNRAESDGSTTLQDRTSGSLTFSEAFNVADDSISVAFPFRGWASEDFYGQITMVVRDNVGSGRKLQCMVKISYFVVSENANVNREIISEYTFTVLPTFDLNIAFPTYMKVLDEAPLQITFDLPEGDTEATLEVVMPLIEGDILAQMSVSNLGLDTYRSIPDADVASLTPAYRATTGEGIKDIGVLSPIAVSVNSTNTTGKELEFSFSAELEMYPGIINGSEIWVGGGVKFGDAFLWVAEVPVYVLDNYDRRPFLKHETVFASAYGNDGTMMATLETSISHELNSSSDHAYDVTMVMYLVRFMNSVQMLSGSQLGTHSATLIDNVYSFTIDKIRVGVTPSFQVNISFDVGDQMFWKTDTFLVISELVYSGGYINSTEWSTGLQHVSFQLNKTDATILSYTDGATCTCNFDNTRLDCGCCKPGGCQCGTENSDICVDCLKMWRCGPFLAGYEEESHLAGEYVCRAYQLRHTSSSGISCFRENPVNTWTNLQPAVGMIIGQDTSTDTIFGISNNGEGYVMSTDQGLTWASVNDKIYADAVNGGGFVNATFASY